MKNKILKFLKQTKYLFLMSDLEPIKIYNQAIEIYTILQRAIDILSTEMNVLPCDDSVILSVYALNFGAIKNENGTFSLRKKYENLLYSKQSTLLQEIIADIKLAKSNLEEHIQEMDIINAFKKGYEIDTKGSYLVTILDKSLKIN